MYLEIVELRKLCRSESRVYYFRSPRMGVASRRRWMEVAETALVERVWEPGVQIGNDVICQRFFRVDCLRVWIRLLFGRCIGTVVWHRSATNVSPSIINWSESNIIAITIIHYELFCTCCGSLSNNANPSTLPLFILWQCQSQNWPKEEGDAIRLCYNTVSLHCNLLPYLPSLQLMVLRNCAWSLRWRTSSSLHSRDVISVFSRGNPQNFNLPQKI